MKNILILQGAPASGKSTWVQKNNLGSYTVSPDTIRLLVSTPTFNVDGSLGINQENDQYVWDLMDKMIEQRMRDGNFTVVDATHTREKYLNRYRTLAERYGYRMYLKQFKVPLDELLERNRSRAPYQIVPDEVIKLHHERLEHFTPSNKFTILDEIEGLNEFVRFNPIEESGFPLYFVGDIHGCHVQLKKFLDEHYTPDSGTYVFLGDYIDRGPDSGATVQMLLDIYKNKNIVFLEGNHEAHLRKWANDEESTSERFTKETAPQLAKLDKAEVRQFCRKLRPFVSLKDPVSQVSYFACHGGVPTPMPNMAPAKQLIFGVGKYTDTIAIYDAMSHFGNKYVMLHGHRNVHEHPIKASSNCFNLDGGVEQGGELRAVRFDGAHTGAIACTEISYEGPDTVVAPDDAPVSELRESSLVKTLKQNPMVDEKTYGDISSFNFSRRAFQGRIWNRQTIKARGLFVRTSTGEVVARSYDKFFNINEIESDIDSYKSFTFPVNIFRKENGFLGILSWDKVKDQPLYCSKSTVGGPFAILMQDALQVMGVTPAKIKEATLSGERSVVLEVVDPVKDPHIISEPALKVVLLGLVENKLHVNTYGTLSEIQDVAAAMGIQPKELVSVASNITELVQAVADARASQTEGVVLEDSSESRKHLKIKSNYYNTWKYMRSLKDRVHKIPRISDVAFEQQTIGFLNWCKQTYTTDELRGLSIIKLRDDYLASLK